MNTRAAGWAGNASAASCTSSIAYCSAPRTRVSWRSAASRAAQVPALACATSSAWTRTRGCRAMPRLDPDRQNGAPAQSADHRCRAAARHVGGYGILQPRRDTLASRRPRSLGVSKCLLPVPSGIDPYAFCGLRRLSGPVRRRLLQRVRGSTTSRGVPRPTLLGRPCQRQQLMLSHDLFEGIYARCGLASDVEVVEEYPSRYDVATASRQHRWDARRLAIAAVDTRDATSPVPRFGPLENGRQFTPAFAAGAPRAPWRGLVDLCWLDSTPVLHGHLFIFAGDAIALPDTGCRFGSTCVAPRLCGRLERSSYRSRNRSPGSSAASHIAW